MHYILHEQFEFGLLLTMFPINNNKTDKVEWLTFFRRSFPSFNSRYSRKYSYVRWDNFSFLEFSVLSLITQETLLLLLRPVVQLGISKEIIWRGYKDCQIAIFVRKFSNI